MSETVTVVVGGYRGGTSCESGPAAGLSGPTIHHNWAGPADSLSNRVDRLLEWNTARVDPSAPVNLVALSMGCQVAVQVGQSIETVGEVLLVAPDPKARPVGRDAEETKAGTVSAFDEARELWSGTDVPAWPFTDAARTLATRAARLRIVCCRTDGVAEWDNNVDTFVDQLTTIDGVELIEAIDGAVVTEAGVTVDLSAKATTDVHERLWLATQL